MIRGPSSRSRARPARPRAAAWSIARGLLMALTLACYWLPMLPRGKSRDAVMAFVKTGTCKLEHIFRCLLISLRAAPAAPKPAPFTPHARSAETRTLSLRQPPAGFSFSLARLVQGFEKYGTVPEALARLEASRRPRESRPPRGPTASAPIADPITMLAGRLAAIRAVLVDPHTHAARFAAVLKAAGIGLRKSRPLVPAGEVWMVARHQPAPRPRVIARLSADTS